MAEGEENKEKRCNTMQMNGFSRDVLHKLEQISNKNEEEEEGDIELSLGLSLNGRFGVDPQRVKRLKRSSSVANVVFGSSNENCNSNNGRCSFSYVPIVRTCSLPVEAEEECRKRKELQSLRRLEAKRKRMEKLQNNNVNKVVVKEENGYNGVGNNSLQLSQGSIGSQGSGSSGISDFGSQGPGNTTGTNTPTTVKSEHEHEHKQVATQPEHTSEKSPSICANASKEAKEMFKNFMLNMPCVSTKGDGPNGKKIEGFLYRYQKGEEVKIVCVCHGNFLSPAEFIKHGGGGDVENPLRHIVVSPAPLLG